MIGIKTTQSPKAASGQSMDDDNPNIKSPSNAAGKTSMITSFFKPKMLKQSPVTPPGNLIQDNLDGLVCLRDPRKDGTGQGKLESKTDKDSTSRLKQEKSITRKSKNFKQSRNNDVSVPLQCSAASGGHDKSTKKRKKNVELDSSSDDFEIDKRTKMPKKEPLKLKEEEDNGGVPEENIPEGDLLENDTDSTCSDEDVFEVKEVASNPKVISYLDFLNESMGENRDEGDDIQCPPDKELKDDGQDVEEGHHVVEKPATKENRNSKKPAEAKKKVTKTVGKLNKFKTTVDAVEKCMSSDVAQEKASDQKPRNCKPSSTSCLSDDDSVLTISYSEFQDDKAGSKSREPTSSSLMYPRQKLVTIEAEVHTPPSKEAMHPGNSPVTIDLCHSPEQLQTPASKKRTSNVVVDVSDLDLMIVSTDNASVSSDNRKSKTVYSIFQKKGTLEKSKQPEAKALKKPESTETSQDAKVVSDVKPKQSRSKKQHKGADFSPETKSRTLRKTDGTLKKACLKTKSGRQAKKTLKSLFDGVSEEENTEEEFEEEISDKNAEGSKRRCRPRKNRQDDKKAGGGDADKLPQRAEFVVLTSTPKAKLNKTTKARQLLRRAKSQQMNKASVITCQLKDTKANTQGAKCAAQINHKLTGKPDPVDQAKKQRDLTNVLGKRLAPDEAVEGKKKEKTAKRGAEKKKAVVTEEEQERKPTKLAPMFTKEGRQALGKRQQTLDKQISKPSVMVIPDDEDETSRDSVRSDVGGVTGGAKLFNDGRGRDLEAEQWYPPFPTISHVLQMDGNTDWWTLPSPSSLGKLMIERNRTLKLIDKKPEMVGHHMRLGTFTRCSEEGEKMPFLKSFTGHPELSHDVQRVILDRIKAANPRFPVNRVFKRYLVKRKGEPLIVKPPHGEGTLEAKGSPNTDPNFTKLKSEKPAKRKSEVLEQQTNSKRRKVAQGVPENETKPLEKIRLRRRSSRWVIRDEDEEEETKDVKEQPKPRRSSRQSKQAIKKEDGAAEPKEQRTLRTRQGKTTGKTKAENEGSKEGSKEAGAGRTVESKADKLASLLWTEKYQPLTSAEIIGNGQAMKRLTGWLTEWKKKTARIKKKMKRQQGRQQNKALLALPIEDSDSDFDLGSDSDNSDSDNDDDDSLSHAMLIVGPCGSGKTAAVYACAKELGFKVFEVNASSKRTGKQILADLGEATQSHHLTAHHHGNGSSALKSFFAAKSPPKYVAKLETKKMPIPKAFAAFYKAGADAVAKQGGKKVKAPTKKSPKTTKPTPKTSTQPLQAAAVMSTTAGQRLTSTSLILFEDVDVVFEEDKGFLSAIATFLKTTKRPIILTTSDGRFPEMFEERYEMVTFRKPPSSQLATHLQLLCLAENVHASHSDLHHLVSLLDRDVRRCWLAAQLWVNSGAGQRSKVEDLEVGKAPAVDKSSKGLGDQEKETNKSSGCHDALPRLHSNCFESTFGLCNLCSSWSGISAMLRIHGSRRPCLHTSSAIAQRFQKESNTSICFRNLHTLLPPCGSTESFCVNQENSTDQSRVESKPQLTNGRTAEFVTHRLVTSLATFADDISFWDSHTFSPRHDGKDQRENGWWGSEVKSSLSLDPVEFDTPDYVMSGTGSSLRGFLEVASFNRCHRNYEKTVDQFRQLHRLQGDSCQKSIQEEMSRTVTKPAQIKLISDQEGRILKLHQDDLTKCPDVYSNIVNKLPLSVHCNHRVLSMEYLPTLRCICRAERIREELKIKRRFLHYLDSISLNLKKTEQITLCSIMEAKQRMMQDDKLNDNLYDL